MSLFAQLDLHTVSQSVYLRSTQGKSICTLEFIYGTRSVCSLQKYIECVNLITYDLHRVYPYAHLLTDLRST